MTASDDRLAIDLARAELRLIRMLIAARQSRGLKPAELARKMGVDRSVVTRFEAGGTNPTMATINRYAEAVGVLITYDVTDHANTEPAHGHSAPSSPHGDRDAVIAIEGLEIAIGFKFFTNPTPQSLLPYRPDEHRPSAAESLAVQMVGTT